MHVDMPISPCIWNSLYTVLFQKEGDVKKINYLTKVKEKAMKGIH